MATFLKTTEISIDGARTLPRRVLHLARDLRRRSWSRSSTEALALRRARGPDPQPGRLLHPGDRARRASSCCATGGRLPGVLQRLPPPRHPALRGAHRPVLRDDPVPLPRLDLRPRRPADRRALHRRHRELRQGRLAAPPGGGGHLGRLPLHQPRRASPSRSTQAWAPLLGRFSRFNLPNLKVAPDHRVRRAGQLEAAVPELLASATTAARSTRRSPSSRRPPAARTTSPRGRSPAASW